MSMKGGFRRRQCPRSNPIVINSRDDADRALQRIGELQRFIEGAAKDAGDEMDKVRQQLVDETALMRKPLE